VFLPLASCLWKPSSVLNLPDSASAEEVRERYKSLSVSFHPDKQREESQKDTASKRFLEIQKAYEGMTRVQEFDPT
jgi:DnaJ-class molecular chaperone